MQQRAALVIGLVAIATVFSTTTQAQCVGDCGSDDKVTVDEVLTLVNLALSGAPPTACTAGDANHSNTITIDEILTAVNNALAALRLMASGICMRPGVAQSLVPCADGTSVNVFRCEDTTRCLNDPSALTMLASAMVEGGNFSLASCTPPGAPLVFAAPVDPQSATQFRIVDFGFVRAGGAAGLTRWLPAASDLTLEGIVLSPVSEAAVRVLDQNGLEHFDAAGATAVIDAVESANAQTQFTGQDPAAAAMLATDTASNDPVVQATITANRMEPTPTPTPLAQTFAIQLLGAGPKGTDPAAGVRVIRNDPTTGAVLADVLTDANGLADFGEIGSDRTTFSIVTTRVEGDFPSLRKETFTFVNFPVHTFPTGHPFRFNLNDRLERPTLATVDVTLANLPTGTNQVQLFAGGFRDSGGAAGRSSATISNFTVDQAQSDGKLSFLANAQDSTGVIRGCGSSVDLDPTAINGLPLTIAVNTPPTPISFTASAPVVLDGAQILRKGAVFDLFNSGPESPVTFGTFNFCSIAGADGFEFSLRTPETPSTSARGISKISPTLPSSLDVTVPSLSIDSLTRSVDGRTISWTHSGDDFVKVDFAFTELDWNDGGTEYRSELVGDPASTSFTYPALPTDLADRVPPASATGIRAGLFGLDITNGFEDFGPKLSAAGGDFNVFQFTATELIQVERTRPILSVIKEGTGSGTVRSSPAGIDCGATCAANFAPGITVLLTAIPDPGSSFAFWSGDNCGGGSGNQISITMDDNSFCTATFNAGG